MFKDKFVFSQLIAFLDRNHFNYLARKYDGDKYVKHLTCWNQLLALMFGQLSNRESLRDLIVALEAHQSKCFHLGLGRKPIAKTTLATANQNRDYRIFEEFAFYMMEQARRNRAADIFKLGGKVYAFDSTTIPLCLSVFWWAKFRKKKGGVKVHVLYDLEVQVPAFYHITTASVHDSKAMPEIPYETGAYYIFDRGYNNFKELFRIQRMESFFVVRAKTNLQYKCVKWKRRMPKNILSDAEIELTVYNSRKDYPDNLRLVRYYDEEQDREFMFLTNAMDLTAQQIADLYKNRWQIELFFKWLKQHLKIKKFWGTTENAVRIQIAAAITAYCLVAIVQHDMKLKRSTYEVLQILSISLTDKTPLRELFDKTYSNDVKEQFGPLIPGLFD
ncbi:MULTISPECIES: IS4 family transposase [Segatella]|jgi:transposase DDE domain|uniref:IS4 family transposase n=1 Tax=Segatella TaxID=2974251 RepID=UPI001290E467|nr:IS4 family transposase [Segatella copri]MQM46546.1 IS4 family transposase [Segatella copri]MQM49234.1 IS4 family transposase [Segatella copri]MQM69195.1 IS4 family transposase [Segatella copri]MQM74066.1 IS4 family transposase [Segatella copri]MQN41730.1 IS4 family transposase [Segatella copri]